MTSFVKFGENFQIKILHHIITDSAFALQVLDSLEPDFFTDESYTELFRIILKHHASYNAVPTFENIKIIVRTKYDDEIQEKYLLDLIDTVEKMNAVSDKKYVIDQVVEFCQQQAMRNAILASVDLLKQEKYGEIQYIIQRAMTAGQSKDIGHSIFDDVYSRTVDKRNPISTGFDILDDYVAGGPSGGELALVLAGTGVGKSMVLAHIATDAMKKGKKVVYYTLELSEQMVSYRVEAKLTGIPLTKLLLDVDGKYRNKVADELKKLKLSFKDSGKEPDIRVKFYPTKTASVSTIRNHLESLRNQDYVPDLIIVDYADLLKPTTRYSDKRFELESLVEQLRGMAGELNIPIWSASQSNRDGLDASIVGLKSISESLAKAMVADLIVSIGRSPELVESDRACYYLAKNRLGKDKVVFTGKFDTTILDFTIDREGLDAEEVTKNDKKNLMKRAVDGVLKNQPNVDKSVNRNLLKIMGELDDE